MANFLVTTADNGGVHTNSGIHNKAAYLIIQGGSFNGYTVRAMGPILAGRLFYNVLVYRLWSGSQLIDARNAALAEVEALRAADPAHYDDEDVCSVRNAFAAVGLGVGDLDCNGVPDDVDPDADGDGRANASDNCPTVFNPGQQNSDTDLMGDLCDNDDDGDGRADNLDNCPTVANPGWADWNGDNQGDACDDSDFDGDVDNADNCRDVYNPDQRNMDFHDNLGDACDDDIDGDGWLNDLERCPLHYNPDQADTTEIAVGLPPDSLPDACDLCPLASSLDNLDSDGDGRANPCDDDDDDDNVLDGDDNCPLEPNPTQSDWNDNGIGLACDLTEQEIFGEVLSGINDRYVQVADLSIPLPVCPDCVINYLPADYQMHIAVQLPINFKARVVDSAGNVVAKGVGAGLTQSLTFSPSPFALTPLGAAGRQGLDAGSGSLPLTEFGPDEVRYYLEIVPAPGTDLNQEYPLTLTLEGSVTRLYLPVLSR
jgi:hypothetical protein